MKSLYQIIGISFISALLSGCKVAGERPVTPAEGDQGSAVFNYVIAEQWALSASGISTALSSIQGYSLVATKNSTFAKWATPANACMFTQQDAPDVTAKYKLDIGQIKIGGFSIQEQIIPKDPESLVFGIGGRLAAGAYHISNSGNTQGSFVFTQNFSIPNAGSNLKITSKEDGTAQSLPSPDIVDESDARFSATIDKAATLKIDYTPPEGVDYVRTTIFDNSNSAGGSVTCYSPAFTSTVIPAGALRYFRTTDDATLFVDFVSVNLKKDAEGIQESFIQSYVRHVHGMQEYILDGQNQTVHYGKLKIR